MNECIYSKTALKFKFEILFKSNFFLLLFTSSPLDFRSEYCTYYFMFIWELKILPMEYFYTKTWRVYKIWCFDLNQSQQLDGWGDFLFSCENIWRFQFDRFAALNDLNVFVDCWTQQTLWRCHFDDTSHCFQNVPKLLTQWSRMKRIISCSRFKIDPNDLHLKTFPWMQESEDQSGVRRSVRSQEIR